MKSLAKVVLGSKVNEPSKILIKTSNVVKYIKSDMQNSEVSRKNNAIM